MQMLALVIFPAGKTPFPTGTLTIAEFFGFSRIFANEKI
jgi:hypothetical protein